VVPVENILYIWGINKCIMAIMSMAKMDQKPKKKLLTPKRVNEVADSLDKEANKKMRFAVPQKRMAEAGIKKGEGDKQGAFYPNSNIGTGPTYNERMKIAKDALSSAAKDEANASRYRKLALMAKNKK
jgi:hypothetical protein